MWCVCVCVYMYASRMLTQCVFSPSCPHCTCARLLRSHAETSSSRLVWPVWLQKVSNIFGMWISNPVRETAMQHFANMDNLYQSKYRRWIWIARRIFHLWSSHHGWPTWWKTTFWRTWSDAGTSQWCRPHWKGSGPCIATRALTTWCTTVIPERPKILAWQYQS